MVGDFKWELNKGIYNFGCVSAKKVEWEWN